jgi:HSP20 family protein
MYNKRNFGLMPRTFGYLFEDALQHAGTHLQEEYNTLSTPVNIVEADNEYELQVFAPGIKKEDLKIVHEKNILTISYEHKEETTEKPGKFVSKEYRQRSFKRSFTLNEKIDASKIAARYVDGILTVALPKKEAAEVATHEVAIN